MDKKAETKEEKFRRVAEKRVNKIISFIEALGRCSATSIYSYNNKQIKKIFDSLQAALDTVHSRFLYPTNNGKNKFSLSGNENRDKTESLKQEISLRLPDGSIISAVAYDEINNYIIWYNTKRIKQSLGYMSPVEYRHSLELAV